MENESLTMLLNFIKEGGFTAVFITLFIMERNAHRETLNKYMEFMRDTVYRREARNDAEEPTRSRRPPNFPAKVYQPPDPNQPPLLPE